MKVYKGKKSMNADKEQMPILLKAGWSRKKPKPTKEELQAKQDALDKTKQDKLDEADLADRIESFNLAEDALEAEVEALTKREKAFAIKEEDLADREAEIIKKEDILAAETKSADPAKLAKKILKKK